MPSFEADGFNAIRVLMMVILSSHSVIQATQVFWRVVIFSSFLTQVAHSVLSERSRVRFPARKNLEFYHFSIIIYKLAQFFSCNYTSYIVNSLAVAGFQFPPYWQTWHFGAMLCSYHKGVTDPRVKNDNP